MQKAKNKHGPDIDIGIRLGWPRGPAIITGEPPPEKDVGFRISDVGCQRSVPFPIAIGTKWALCPLVSLSLKQSDIGYSGLRPLVPKLVIERSRNAPCLLVSQEERHCEMRAVASRGDPPGERWRSGTGKRDGPAVFARGPDKVWPPVILKSEKRRRWRPRDFVTLGQPDESPPGIVKRLIVNNIDSKARNNLPDIRRLEEGEFEGNNCLTATLGFSCEREKSFRPESYEKKTRGHGDGETRRVEIRSNILNGIFLASLIKQNGIENQVQRTAIFVEYDMNEQPKVQPVRLGRTHRNIKRQRTKTGILPRNPDSYRDAETQPSFHYGGQAQRHATIDFRPNNRRIVEWSEWGLEIRN